VEVIERNDAVSFESVTNTESQLRRETADSSCQMCHDDCVDAVGNGVACKDEHGAITASPDVREPDLASLH
jgi:hypothetical protein